jgi:N-methylhydantoinase B
MVVCLMELMFRCFARLVPDRCPAGGYQLTGTSISRTQTAGGLPFIMAEPVHGGNGALHDNDGSTNQLVANGDLPNTPVEVLEKRFPVRVERMEFAPESAGQGRLRGGMGVRKDYQILESGCYAALITQNTKDRTGVGVEGGETGTAGYFILNPGTTEQQYYDRSVSSVGPLPCGTVIRVVTGGGGGWGLPLERDPTLVLADVEAEFLDTKSAESIYGVALVESDAGWAVDVAQSSRLRSSRVASELSTANTAAHRGFTATDRGSSR